MKHKHAEMIKKKADNMELCVFFIHTDRGEKWSVAAEDESGFPNFNNEYSFFICHPNHKEVCLSWLNGSDIEEKQSDGEWLHYEPSDSIFLVESKELRIKPKTININGHEVPEPVRELTSTVDVYYTPDVHSKKLFSAVIWDGLHFDRMNLKRGIMHLTPEAAIAHAKAMLSIVRKN